MRASYMKGGGIAEALLLYRNNYGDIPNKVSAQLREATNIEALLSECFGEDVRNKQMLEIGPGPHAAMTHYFSVHNSCVGIDIEVAARSGLISSFVTDLKASGASRAIRNAVKRVSGINRRYEKELARQLGVARPGGEIRRMDATDMEFENNCFDAVVSLSALEHIPDPAAVMKDVARVLQPGGVAVVITHFITSDSGIHDPRLFDNRQDLPWWAHLRDETKDEVAANCYVNWVRVDEYRKMFASEWPGARFQLLGETAEKQRELAKLRAEGMLQDYSDEELVNDVLVTIWKKP